MVQSPFFRPFKYKGTVLGPRPAVYDSTFVESGWYDWWERSGQFRYQGDLERPFTMCLPPPNVTGDLHIGHALTVTIEDVLARW